MFRRCILTVNKFFRHPATKSSIVGNNDVLKTFVTSTHHLAKQVDKITVTFIKPNDSKLSVEAKVGDNLLDVVVENDVDIDGFGACEGTLACSTCHLIFHQKDYDKLPSKPSDEEMDMLDLAYDLQDTSRLGCQIILTKDMDGLEVIVPKGTMDARDV